MSYELISFDLDGTLADTAAEFAEAPLTARWPLTASRTNPLKPSLC